MSKPIIAVDVDDVIFPFVPEILTHSNQLRGTSYSLDDFSAYHFSEVWNTSEEEANEIVASFLTKDVVHLQPVPGAKRALELLAKDFSLYVVTARNKLYAPRTRQWLDAHFKSLFTDIIFAGNPYDTVTYRAKGEICEEIGADLLIDDSPHNLQSALDYGVDGVLFGAHVWNQVHNLPVTVPRCETWEEVVEYIQARQPAFKR